MAQAFSADCINFFILSHLLSLLSLVRFVKPFRSRQSYNFEIIEVTLLFRPDCSSLTPNSSLGPSTSQWSKWLTSWSRPTNTFLLRSIQWWNSILPTALIFFLQILAFVCSQMAWLGFFTKIFPTTLCRGVKREKDDKSLSWFEPTSVELHQNCSL